MPDNGTSQGIDVGDAVLTFLADSTQLDAAFQKIPAQAQASMTAAAASVGQVGDAVDDVSDRMAVGAQGAVKLGEITTLAGEKTRASMYEARGEVGLLGEAFGISLPRHVRSFVAELPGVGAALSGAFAATAVLFLIEALAKGVEKIQEWAEHAHKMALAWEEFNTSVAGSFRGLDEKLLQTGIKLDELKGNHVDALRKALELIDHTSLHELEQQFGVLAKAADAMFDQLKASWYELSIGSTGAKYALDDFKAKYDLLLAEGKDKDASDLLAGTLKSAKESLRVMQEAKKAAEDSNTLEEQAGGPSEKQLQSQEVLVRALQAQIDAQTKIIELTKEQKQIKESEEGNKSAERDATEAKRVMDQQIASIDAWKSAQHAAYDTGKIDAAAWQVAELRATDAVAIAKEDYLRKLVSLYTRAGETEKAHAAQEQLATLQTKNEAEGVEKLSEAVQKHAQAVRRTREEYDQLIASNVDKEFAKTQAAAQKLTQAEEELAKAEAKLAETNLTAKYRDEESAIQKLAQLHLITEQQMNDRLAVLERQQANEAIAILQKQLDKQQADMQAAQQKLAAQKTSAFVSQAQVIETEANLKKIEAAIVATEAQIVQAKEKYNKQSEADTKSHYGRALILAMASGNEILAEQLRQNHALLLSAQSNLADAKARGADTTAIEQQIKALKQNETALQKEASGGKIVTSELQKNVSTALLAAQSELVLAKARGENTKALEKEIKDLQQLENLMRKQPAEMKNVGGALQGLKLAYQQLGDMVKQTEQQMSQAYATAIMGALESGKSIGAALEAATKQVLMQLATQALAKAIFYTAEGIANSVFDPPLAATYFAAAGEFAVVAGLAGGIGMAIPGGGGSSGASGGSGGAPAGQGAGLNPQQSSFAGGGSQQTVGVTRLATGGVVSSPTTFMAGDSPSGGSADEAILPLSDPSAMRKVAQAIIGSIIPISQDRGKEAAMVSNASAVSAIPGNEFGVPSVRQRPDFNFSETPVPRETPDVQAMAARFGGLLSVPTLRAATAASNQAARASAETAASPGGFDHASFEKFADRVGQHVAAASGPTTAKDSGGEAVHIHMPNLKGVVSPESIKKVFKQAGRMVQNRQMTLNASNSLRLTRRSQ